MDNISLAKYLKRINPKVNIIFVTAYNQYAMEAISLLEKHKVWIQCFGNFEVFASGEPVKFTYNKTKELLAFLIDRKGAFCSNAEMIEALWENAENNVKKILSQRFTCRFNKYLCGTGRSGRYSKAEGSCGGVIG